MQGFFKLWLVFQEIGGFQENQFVPDKGWRHCDDHVSDWSPYLYIFSIF